MAPSGEHNDNDISALFNFSDCQLTGNQLKDVRALLYKYSKVIAQDSNDLGRTSTVSHSISVQGARKYRRLQELLRD